MYDPRSEPKEFFGADRAEAVAQACTYYGVSEGDLTVREPAEVSGLAGRAVVVAQPTADVGRRPAQERGERGDRERGDRERGGRGGRGREPRERGGRGRDRGGRDRDRGDRDRGDREPRAARPALSDEPSTGTATGELGTAGEYVLGIVERMDVGPFEIRVQSQDRFDVVELRGAAAQSLSAGDGRTQEAIQLLANQMVGRADEDAKRIVVDVEGGNREKREAFLARVADRAAKRALETGRVVALDPMNGKDRRDIHVALRDAEGVATMSTGEGAYRQVLVVPEGAPEYEEARKAAEAARNAE